MTPNSAFKMADLAAREGRLEEALQWYEQIVLEPDLGAEDRAHAERAIAFLRLSPAAGMRDLMRSRTALERLRQLPALPLSYETAHMFSVVDELLDVRRQLDQATVALAESRVAAASAQGNLAVAKQSLTSAEGQRDRLRRADDQIAALNAENQKLLAELQRKDAALRKVTETLAKGRRLPD